MKKLILLLLTSFNYATIQAQVPNCAVIGMEHFGGNRDDQIAAYPGVIKWSDGSFGFTLYTNSTSGNTLVTCGDQNIGGLFYRNYDADYSTQTSQACVKKGYNMYGSTFYVYPQNNGDTIIVGRINTDSNGTGLAIERHSATGTLLWAKNYGGTGSDDLLTVREAADGGFYLLAGTNSTDGDVGLHYGSHFTADMWLLRLDNDGNKQWATLIGGSENDALNDIHLNTDGSCVMFGITNSSDYDCTGQHGAPDLYIIKLDSLGNKLWHKCLGGTGYDGVWIGAHEYGIWAQPDHQGGFYVLNSTESQDGDVQHNLPDDTDFWLLHIDSAANILWERTYGGPTDQWATSFCQGADGTLWMAGNFQGTTTPGGLIDVTYGFNDCWVVHVDTFGNFINQRVLGTNDHEKMNVLYPLPDGTVLAAGRYYKNGNPGNASPFFPQTTEGSSDIFIAHLGPQTVGIEDYAIPATIWEVFPNPSKDHLKVQIKGDVKDTYKLEVFSINGTKVHTSVFNKETTVNTQQWAAGNYTVVIMDKNEKKDSKKITVQH